MKHYSIGKLALTAVTLLTLTACHDDQQVAQYDFTATLEQLQPESNGSKVYLVNESWIYWELGDMISINCDQGAPEPTDGGIKASGYLTGASGDFENYNGSFATTLNWGAKYFLGLHPYDADNVITPVGAGNRDFSDIKIKLKAEQTYRTDEKGDLTFDKQVLPMVAWFGGEWDDSPSSTAFNLDFRSLAGLVRLQFYNKTAEAHNITSIVVTSQEASKPLSGMFNVRNYKTYDPHLEMASPTSPTVTLTMPDGGLPFAAGDLKSFYLVLPAIHGRDVHDSYSLSVTVNTDAGSFTKNVTVPLRRNGITYLRAIGITGWDATPTVEPGLVGNGTQARPFKIYTFNDLVYLRNCFHNPVGGIVYVNGQEVTSTTYFRIMRSDIRLDEDYDGQTNRWGSGIENFTGKMSYAANESGTGTNPGITNRSSHPIFESITANGEVRGLTVKFDQSVDFNTYGGGATDFSPFCTTNEGQIIDCRISSPNNNDSRIFTSTYGGCFAGLCVTNSGTISGCDCAVRLQINNSGNFAGICKQNNNPGVISGCMISSPASIQGAINGGGVCYTNMSRVEDCYCEFTYTSSAVTQTNWGGIVYQNTTPSGDGGASNFLISHCYLSGNSIIRSNGNVGGIVCVNRGTVDKCHAEQASLQGAKVGAIAVTVSSGELRNCYVNDSNMVISLYKTTGTHCAGGIAAELATGGSIKNCFALLQHITRSADDATGIYGNIVGRMTGGTVENCYSLAVDAASPLFYGSKSGGTLTSGHCFLVDNTATQDAVTQIQADDTHLNDLLTSLSSWVSSHGSEYQSWTRGSDYASLSSTNKNHRAPSLATTTAKKRHRK
ncbi:MAG: hypothetical protein K6E96_05040 [Bacteroidales bacterium]|nr:hypothetical protein [Bacteroidales bacterium]